MQPLCQECLARGITQKGELVHHEPALEILLQRGLNPLDHAHLVTLCTRCHMGHLRAKRL